MELITALRDIARYLTLTPAMERVRLTPYPERCHMDAMFGMRYRVDKIPDLQGAYNAQQDIEGDPLAVMQLEFRSHFKGPVSGIPEPIGIPSPHLLAAVLNHPDYSEAEATIVNTKRSGTCLMLKGSDDNVYSMGLDTGNILDTYFPRKKFPLVTPAITFEPTDATIELLQHWSRESDKHFDETPVLAMFTKGRKVVGRFGSGPSNFIDFPLAGFTLARGIQGTLNPHFVFHTATTLKLMKLQETADVSVQVYAEGKIKFIVNSKHARYVFIIAGYRIYEASTYADLQAAMEVNLAEQKLKELQNDS